MLQNLFFSVRFYHIVAVAVTRKIVRLNGGTWPRTLSRWQVVAGKLGYVLLLVRDDPAVRSCCLFGERAILIHAQPDERLLLRDVAHEIAHAVLEVSGPMGTLLDWPRDGDDCHYVARLVEESVDVAMVEDSQTAMEFER